MSPLPLLAALLVASPPPQAEPTARPPAPQVETITRKTRDGITLTADHVRPPLSKEGEGVAPWAILVGLHMARSSRGEYRGIAEELSKEGLEVLAVDLRSGAKRYMRTNESAKDFEAQQGRPATFEEAYDDVLVAIAWARELAPGKPVLLCGSSYSASLAMLVAAREPNAVDAVLAFSPGEYFRVWRVGEEAEKITVPVYVTSGTDAKEHGFARMVSEHVKPELLTQWLPPKDVEGMHRVTILAVNESKSREAHWIKLRGFLAKIRPETN
jgi:dienelactone hydrolase